jgi:hypothetical protein
MLLTITRLYWAAHRGKTCEEAKKKAIFVFAYIANTHSQSNPNCPLRAPSFLPTDDSIQTSSPAEASTGSKIHTMWLLHLSQKRRKRRRGQQEHKQQVKSIEQCRRRRSIVSAEEISTSTVPPSDPSKLKIQESNCSPVPCQKKKEKRKKNEHAHKKQYR